MSVHSGHNKVRLSGSFWEDIFHQIRSRLGESQVGSATQVVPRFIKLLLQCVERDQDVYSLEEGKESSGFRIVSN